MRVRVNSGHVGVLSVLVGLLLLSLAGPALGGPARAGTADPSAAMVSPSLAAAQPSPAAPHSGQVVPGVTGAAARENDPPGTAAQHLAQIRAVASDAAAGKVPAVTPTPGTGAVTPRLAPWSGTLHFSWGTYVNFGETVYGIQATQSVNPGIVAPNSTSDFLYAPTLFPIGSGTVEMTTIYDATGDSVGAWNWGAGQQDFAKTTPVNASFLATYATKVGSQYYYSVQDLLTNAKTNAWTAYLYDYKTKGWDTFYSSSGQAPFPGDVGWDIDEMYTNYNKSAAEGDYCAATHGDLFASTGLEYKLTSSGTWTSATSANSFISPLYPHGSILGCADLGFALPAANSAFALTNSTHAAARLTGTGSGKCADVSGGTFASGDKIELNTCASSAGQAWAYNSDGELTTDSGKYCLTAPGNAAAGARLQLSACANTSAQEWTFSINHSLVSETPGGAFSLCAEVAGAGTANGTPLDLGTCAGQTNQKWAWTS
jgi:hypothetical protein